jgi:hypothetical protein
VASEIEPRAAEEADTHAQFRALLALLAEAGLLRYAVGSAGEKLDTRSLCLIR